jgi:hypothetical protein
MPAERTDMAGPEMERDLSTLVNGMMVMIRETLNAQAVKDQFVPWATTMRSDSEISILTVLRASNQSDADVIAELYDVLRAKAPGLRAAAAVLVIGDDLMPTTRIHCEHCGGMARDVLAPWRRTPEGGVEFFSVSMRPAEPHLWVPPEPGWSMLDVEA